MSEQNINSIRSKFKSGNDIPVTRAWITREEYIAIEELQARIKELEALLTPLSDYLKECETPVECIIRNHKDVDYLLTELANKMREAESAKAKVKEIEAQRDALLNGFDKALTKYATGQPMQFVADKLAEVYDKIEAEKKKWVKL